MQAGDTDKELYERIAQIAQAALNALKEFHCEDVPEYQRELNKLIKQTGLNP